MSGKLGPDIVTDGLVLCLDAADKRSYPGSGNTWYDLSSSGYNLQKFGSPSFGVFNGAKCWRFLSDGDRFYQGIGLINFASLSSYNLTIEAIFFPEDDVVANTGFATIVMSSGFYHSLNKTSRKLSNYWYDKTIPGYHASGSAIPNDNWCYTAAVWNNDDSKVYQYFNLEKTSSTTYGQGRLGNTYLNIGRESSARQFSGCISVVRIYNRALSDSEIQQNYKMMKGRYNL